MILPNEVNQPLKHSQDNLLWIDCEFTGLSTKNDLMLEIAAIATDYYLRPVAQYTSFIRQDAGTVSSLLDQNEWWSDRTNHKKLMLHGTTTAVKNLSEIDQEIGKFTSEWVGEDNVILAGNSIHTDRLFINRDFPHLASMLSYRMVDVSSFKIITKKLLGQEYQKNETHRASEDIVESIEELRFILELIGNSDIRQLIVSQRSQK